MGISCLNESSVRLSWTFFWGKCSFVVSLMKVLAIICTTDENCRDHPDYKYRPRRKPKTLQKSGYSFPLPYLTPHAASCWPPQPTPQSHGHQGFGAGQIHQSSAMGQQAGAASQQQQQQEHLASLHQAAAAGFMSSAHLGTIGNPGGGFDLEKTRMLGFSAQSYPFYYGIGK